LATTAQTIIDRALRLISAIASGSSPTASETADGLTALNAMIASWQLDKLNVYAYVDTSFPLTANDASYTVGPSGNFDLTPRPPKIEQVFVRNANIDYLVELIDYEKWYAIPDKTSQTDIPIYAYYEPSLATGTLKLWPVPNSPYDLHIITWSSLSELATAATTITLPPGYERALAYNLAIEIASEYGAEVPASVAKIANDSYAAIKRANIRPMLAYSELQHLIRGQKSNIFSGGYVA
jgi:hypothetical protein